MCLYGWAIVFVCCLCILYVRQTKVTERWFDWLYLCEKFARRNSNFFKVCKSVHHRIIQINHQPHATVFHFIILTFIYSSTCFGRSFAHHQEPNDCSGSLWFHLRIVVTGALCSWSGRLYITSPTTNTARLSPRYGGKTKKAATAVIELLMMSGKTPETCWAVNKRQDNEMKNCCMWLVIYLNWNSKTFRQKSYSVLIVIKNCTN